MKTLKKLYNLFYEKTKFNAEKKHLFIYLAQGTRKGGSVVALLESIYPEYKKLGLKMMEEKVEKALVFMEEGGLNTAEAFFQSGLFSSTDKTAFEAIAKTSMDDAFEHLISTNKSKNEFKYAIMMLFTPVLFVLMGYIIFMPEIRGFAESLLEPVNAVSSTKIELPYYFKDRTIFVIGFFTILSIAIGANYIVERLKITNPALLFKYIKLIEREFIVNNFTLIMQLMNSGLSLENAVEVIRKETKDPLAIRILGDAQKDAMLGYSFSHTIEKYISDYATISFLKSGEKTNQIEASLDMILDHNKLLYEKTIARLVVWLPLTGEIMMTIILLIPLIEIINTTTIKAMNFTV